MANEEQTLHRQVHPSWVQEGRITSQAFSPTPIDAGLLPVHDGKQIAAEGSFNHYTTVLKVAAIGAVSVAESEVTTQRQLLCPAGTTLAPMTLAVANRLTS